eukprot:5485065-Prymnesium_polylepis.1
MATRIDQLLCEKVSVTRARGARVRRRGGEGASGTERGASGAERMSAARRCAQGFVGRRWSPALAAHLSPTPYSASPPRLPHLSLIHISEPTRRS